MFFGALSHSTALLKLSLHQALDLRPQMTSLQEIQVSFVTACAEVNDICVEKNEADSDLVSIKLMPTRTMQLLNMKKTKFQKCLSQKKFKLMQTFSEAEIKFTAKNDFFI